MSDEPTPENECSTADRADRADPADPADSTDPADNPASRGEEMLSSHGEEILRDMSEAQLAEAQEYALEFLKQVLRLRGVRIDREQFLQAELHRRGVGRDDIAVAITKYPAAANISLATLDEIADALITSETRKSSAISFGAGVPGGIAMLGTVPGDLVQFYIHAFRIMQKLAYLYGWQSFLEETEDIDDETLGIFASFLGVMMGVQGASGSLALFANNMARPAIEKQISKQALTKTVWYGPLKKVLRMVGVNVTKQGFARSVTKVIPVISGVLSGGFTMVTMGSQSRRLMNHLRVIPPPNVDAETYLAQLGALDEHARELERAPKVDRAVDLAKNSASRASDAVSTMTTVASGAMSTMTTVASDATGVMARLAGGVADSLGARLGRKQTADIELWEEPPTEPNGA